MFFIISAYLVVIQSYLTKLFSDIYLFNPLKQMDNDHCPDVLWTKS